MPGSVELTAEVPRTGQSKTVSALLWLVPLALTLRILFFTGLSLGDDVFYALQSIGHAIGGQWPPEPFHWQTRLGMTLPTALAIGLFGLNPIAFVLWPLIASVAGVVVCYRVARDFATERVAILAATFQACFPLELIYSTHLFPDVPTGLFASLSLWSWIRALRSDSWRYYLVSADVFRPGVSVSRNDLDDRSGLRRTMDSRRASPSASHRFGSCSSHSDREVNHRCTGAVRWATYRLMRSRRSSAIRSTCN